ncbi:NaeI family type II restriction endonuclease [Kitasatospora sp. NPDC048365]|uniref:NaeI family type II restriction endonuclease n=1 Tax=Kitasatospora sp. NPDC048365 TaxID=3364050 RepID=UPI00371CB14A
MGNQDDTEIDLADGQWLPPRGTRTMIFQKDLDPDSLTPESYALAIELRTLAQRVGTSLSTYARHVNWDRSTVSRYFSGVLVAPAEFVERLIADGDRHLGVELTTDARTLVRRLQREALRATSPTSADIQDLKDDLAEAERHRELLHQETRLLRDMVKAAHTKVEEQDVQLRALERSSAADRLTARAELALRSADYEDLRSERDRLRNLLDKLKEELAGAERRAVAAEERCAVLERQLEAAEEEEDEEDARWEAREDTFDGEMPPRFASDSSATGARTVGADADADAQAVVRELERLDPNGQRMTSVLVAAMDRVIDAVHTGRFRLAQASVLERTSLHAITANLIQHEFGLPDGEPAHFLVAGCPVRYCFSTHASWAFSAKAMHQHQICLLVNLNEEDRHWSMGVVLATPDHLVPYGNNVGKRRLNATGVAAIHWLHRKAELPVSALCGLSDDLMADIMSGQSAHARVTALFRSIQGRPIDLRTIEAVVRRPEPIRRIREVRPQLASEGIVVLGHRPKDNRLARDLGLPVPGRQEWLAVRLARMRSDHGSVRWVLLAGERWCVARPADPVEPLPPSNW